jgi:hypothetical protein
MIVTDLIALLRQPTPLMVKFFGERQPHCFCPGVRFPTNHSLLHLSPAVSAGKMPP